ncbi:tRNA-methyltransferase subunit [Tieghemostelium lacteum]|uniref:tRNA (adenine(58)-N(1))-methyltransferase non-catalytic subunit TRM6 n=1 Tax=Tieghemostelium lacteum TaxID=361077 RepID=A0A151ZRT1_TIELA|nr:tRNA-methyltransferase subunit [Tieghemostelium lacteum]|eukprot:KYQ96687.1 tRNA-methyltransferase subunit [Tieghemostelium lacteum]
MNVDEKQNSTTPPPSQISNDYLIKDGDQVILEINQEKLIVVKLQKNKKISVSKKDVESNILIGQPYYSLFQLDGKTVKRVTQKELDVQLEGIVQLNQTEDANNKDLGQNHTSQKLTQDEIQQMKQSGKDSSTIIRTLIENSSTFQGKTSFSQLKYLKKKIKKYTTVIKVIKPTAKTLNSLYYSSDPKKICFLRFDTLSQILTMANIHSTQKVLLMETTSGYLTGAIAERMNSPDGLIFVPHIGNGGPNLSIVKNFGLSKSTLDTIKSFELKLIDQLNQKNLISSTSSNNNNNNNNHDNNNMDIEEQPDKKKLKVDQTLSSTTSTKDKEILDLIENGGYNSLIVVTKYSPLSLTLSLFPYLNASGQFVIYSQFIQQLLEVHQVLQDKNLAVNLNISEIWMREYQVLPKRTHPEMSMDGASGYILTGIKVKTTNNIKPTSPISTSTSTTTTTTTTTTPPVVEPTSLEMNVDTNNDNDCDKKRKREDDTQ